VFLYYNYNTFHNINTSSTTITDQTKAGAVPGIPRAVTFLCPAGFCATNAVNGEKTCPTNTSTQLSYDPETQVCNPPFSCTDGRTPYAVQSDGSVDPNGNCGDGPQGPIQCLCIPTPQCANNILVYFSNQSGSPYSTAQGNRYFLSQTANYINASGQTIQQPPLKIPDLVSNFCTLPPSWLDRLNPRTCIRGTLAYLPDNPDNFDPATTNLGCVYGSTCQAPFTAVWDPRVNTTNCQIVPIPVNLGVVPFVNATGSANVTYIPVTENSFYFSISTSTNHNMTTTGYLILPGILPIGLSTTVQFGGRALNINGVYTQVDVYGYPDGSIRFLPANDNFNLGDTVSFPNSFGVLVAKF
jgi:hypothetical protein